MVHGDKGGLSATDMVHSVALIVTMTMVRTLLSCDSRIMYLFSSLREALPNLYAVFTLLL